jgi:hypothetical protein
LKSAKPPVNPAPPENGAGISIFRDWNFPVPIESERRLYFFI